jgi:hypothetical protein
MGGMVTKNEVLFCEVYFFYFALFESFGYLSITLF